MIIFPAIDIKDGQAVRLKQGKASEVTVFSDDPVKTALQWQAQGARFLHVVDLDGAFDGKSANASLVRNICTQLSIPVQLGGGIRDEQTARHWLDAGVTRLIVGTMALEEPERFARMCLMFPGRIGVSLDAENGRLKTRGWVNDVNKTVDEVLPSLTAAGSAFFVYTDISRDGMHTGVNMEALTHMAKNSETPIIASGGVSTLEDIKQLYALSLESNLEGVITGRALYEQTLNLGEALSYVKQNMNKLPK